VSAELITPEILDLLRRSARSVSRKTNGNVDSDELFSVAQSAAVSSAARFVLGKASFRSYVYQRANGAMLDYLRATDPMSRRDRATVKVAAGKSDEELTAVERKALNRRRFIVHTDAQAVGYLDREVKNEGVGDTRKLDTECLIPALLTLNAIEQFCVWQSFVEEKRYADIGAFLGMTTQRVQQIIGAALPKLRKAYRASA
jgi:RNA polymerase sigma factor (sigma-70 family)